MKLGDLRFHSFTHMTEQLYYKKGRRYYPWGTTDSWDHERDAMKAGSCRLTYCPAPGHYRYRYDVTPNSAAWMAAAMVAEHAMQEAMAQKATATPCNSLVYTEEQRQILEKFRKDMAAAGGLIPSYWVHGTPAEIAKAGVDAVIAAEATTPNLELARDAARYRWIKAQTNLSLRTNPRLGVPWTNTDTGEQFYPSHNLDVNGTGFSGIETLDQLIDQAMDLYP